MSLTTRLTLVSLLAVLLATISGCAVFLPAHTNSYSQDNESVVIDMIKVADLDAAANEDFRSQFTSAFGSTATTRLGEPVLIGEPLYVLSETPDGRLRVFEAKTLDALIALISDPKLAGGDGSLKTASGAAIAASAAGIAFDVAAGFVESQLDAEAQRYAADYSAKQYIDEFWLREDRVEDLRTVGVIESSKRNLLVAALGGTKNYKGYFPLRVTPAYRQNYAGFRMTRKSSTRSNCFQSKAEGVASVLEVGFCPSKDQQLFLIAPLSYDLKRTKAKILQKRWWTYLPFVYGLWLDASENVKTEILLEMSTTWREKIPSSGSQKALIVTENVFSERLTLPNINLNDLADGMAEVTASTGFGGAAFGWYGGFPISFDYRAQPVGYGTGMLQVTVKERDVSRAPETVTQLKKELVERKPALRQSFIDAVAPGEQSEPVNTNAGDAFASPTTSTSVAGAGDATPKS